VNNHKPDTPRHTTTAPNPIPPPFTGNRKRTACIRRKGDTDQQRSQQKPHFPALTAVSCAPSLTRDTIVPLMQNPTMPTKYNPTQPTKAFISSPIASPCKIHNDKGPAHQLKSQICDNSLTLLPIECSSRLGTTTTQQPFDIKDDTSTDPPSCNEALLLSSATNPPNTTFRRNSIPYSRAYRYRTFCTTYGNPVKPGSIWHFRSRHHLLQHPSAPTVILRRYHLQQALTELQRTPPNTKYTSPTTTTKPFKTPRNDTSTTAPSLDTQPNMQILLTIYIRELGRPGPPWPPPTNHTGVRVDLRTPTVIALENSPRPPTATRPSHARPHPIHLPRVHLLVALCTDTQTLNSSLYHQYLSRWFTYLTTAMIRAKLRDIRQYYNRRPGPQPQTAAKNLLRPP